MGFFSLTRKLAVDLGTANTVIIEDGKIIIDQPSYVTLNKKTDKVEWVGAEAYRRFEKENNDLSTVRPLKDGVVADLDACEYMIRGMIRMATTKKHFFPTSLKVVVCVPSGSTDVEIRAVRDAAEKAGANEVYLIHEPMAAAIGIGIDIGERTAEEIKKNVGSALDQLDNEPEPYTVVGQDLASILPKTVDVNYHEISTCLDKSITKIETAIGNALDDTAPELYADIFNNGIYLAGGGAQLKGLDKRLQAKFQIPFKIADDPLYSVANGTFIALQNSDKYTLLFK